MIASSRPVYSPINTVIFEVPISTAPMKVVLELTFEFRLGRGKERKAWTGARWRRGLEVGGRNRLERDRHLAAQRQIHPRSRARDPRQAIEDLVEIGELHKKTSLAREQRLRPVLHRHFEFAVRLQTRE